MHFCIRRLSRHACVATFLRCENIGISSKYRKIIGTLKNIGKYKKYRNAGRHGHESCATAAWCSCARMVHWKVKVTSSLTDVWQQLFEQQDITVIVLCTIHFHPWLHENHTSAPAPGDTDWNQNAGPCSSETSEVCPWAEMASDWNMVSNQQSFVDQSIDQWQDCFIACLKVKSKHFEHLLWCVSLIM